MEDDWRWLNLGMQPIFKGLVLQRIRYTTPSSEWDHDHCIGCMAKFMESDMSNQELWHEGYTTNSSSPKGAKYWWVCPTCFNDFKDAMEWTEVTAEAGS